MARLAGDDFSEERPVTRMSQEFKDWYELIARERWTENRKRNPADPLYPRGLGDTWGFGAGLLFPEPSAPLKIKVTKYMRDSFTDFLASLYVSNRIRLKVEEMEPGVHQFLPLEVELPDGIISEQSYWIWCNMNVLDTVVLEKCKYIRRYYFNKETWPDYYEYEEYGDHINKPVLAINKSIIRGKTKWSDYKLGHVFFSEEFANWLDSEGIKGWEANNGTSRRTAIIELR